MNDRNSSLSLWRLHDEASKIAKDVAVKRALISQFDDEFTNLQTAVNEYNDFATTHTKAEMFSDANEPVRKKAYRAADAIHATLQKLD